MYCGINPTELYTPLTCNYNIFISRPKQNVRWLRCWCLRFSQLFSPSWLGATIFSCKNCLNRSVHRFVCASRIQSTLTMLNLESHLWWSLETIWKLYEARCAARWMQTTPTGWATNFDVDFFFANSSRDFVRKIFISSSWSSKLRYKL